MKRLLLALLLACLAGTAAYAIFYKARSDDSKFDCEMSWLSQKLALTPEQSKHVRELHEKFCPSMNGMKAKLACCDAAQKTELQQACCASSDKLVEAVSAELTPSQREAYAKLLVPMKCPMDQKAPK
jgi:hypothetical protein